MNTWISRSDNLWQALLWEHKWPSSECDPFLGLSTKLQLRSAAPWGRKSKFALQDLCPFFWIYPILFTQIYPYLLLQESWASPPTPSVLFIACHLEMVLTSFDKHIHLESQCGCSKKRRHFFFSPPLYELDWCKLTIALCPLSHHLPNNYCCGNSCDQAWCQLFLP